MTPTRWATLASALYLLSVGVVVWLHVVGPLTGDRAFIDHIREHNQDALAPNVSAPFTLIGFAPVSAVIVVLAWRLAGGFAVLAALAPVVSTTFKLVAGPVPLGPYAFGINAPGSYPSGHVAFVAGLFGYLGVLAARAGHRVRLALCVVVVAGMGPTRVLAGAHFPSDVLGGYLVGFAWLCGLLAAEPRLNRTATR